MIRPIDQRLAQIKLRIHPPIKWLDVLVGIVVFYGLLTAALVVTP